MSIAWMAFVAGLIAVEKLLPWRRVATYGTAAILLALGVLLLAAPDAIPALTVPAGEPDAADGDVAQSGYSSLRQARGSAGSSFGVRLSRNEW